MEFVSVDRILGKVHRDLKGINLNETDAIEWIGEALDFLKTPEIQEETVAFTEVENHETILPLGFHAILQVARNNEWTPKKKEKITPKKVTEEANKKYRVTACDEHEANKKCYPVPLDCNGRPITDYEVAYYRPFFDLKWEYELWTKQDIYKKKYTPVRLSNNVFFNSLVCKEKNKDIYKNSKDEYTLIGNNRLRFSFKDGHVAISYLKNKIDENTGYPLIPDNISYIQAITYYIKWKISEWYTWNGREGFNSISQNSERLWLKYANQSKNTIKMPKSLDDFQNLLENTHYLIPNRKKYTNFFAK